ncbi:hypothetical protein [Mycolicibacterium gilvum]|uniref:hypothetical protein n=1 Tax=Mycolicibacterium gilvum TaxID=1804 RepID=UPI0011564F40
MYSRRANDRHRDRVDHERLRRAELAAELGFVPASLDADAVERHRRLNAAADRAPNIDRVHAKYAHIREYQRRERAEAAGRLVLEDVVDDADHQGTQDVMKRDEA